MKFEELVNIVARLRAPDGCPWDREQTRESLKPYLVEEFHELLDAMDENDNKGIREELGDLLLQIVMQSQLAKEEKLFDIDDVVDSITEKMVCRHPHVFGNKGAECASDVELLWDDHKKREGKVRNSALDGVPKSLPALLRAQQLQLKASKAGFDWERINDIIKKLDEEIREFKEALDRNDKSGIKDEFGDILFVLVRIANSVNINPEDSLRGTINRFYKRFENMELNAERAGKNLSEMSLEEMNDLWEEAKKNND